MNLRIFLVTVSLISLLWTACAGPKPVVPENGTVAKPVENIVEAVKDPIPPDNTPPDGNETFEVTEEVYKATFKEIEELIFDLNKIIQNREYETWKTFLDQHYVDFMSDPKYLSGFNETPILKKYSIKLTKLADYFDYVVVPSRSNAKLDEIVFLDETRVIAYMYIKNQKTILYQLKYDGQKWLISLW